MSAETYSLNTQVIPTLFAGFKILGTVDLYLEAIMLAAKEPTEERKGWTFDLRGKVPALFKKEMKFKGDLQREIYYRSQIDYSYWMIQEISKHSGKPQSPLEAMVDKSTGFDKTLVKQRIEEFKYLVGVIIRCKNKLGYDAKNDRKFLIEIKKI